MKHNLKREFYFKKKFQINCRYQQKINDWLRTIFRMKLFNDRNERDTHKEIKSQEGECGLCK